MESRTSAPTPGATSSTASSLDYLVRPGTKADHPFVARSWVLTLRASSRALKRANPATFFRHHHRVIDEMLADPAVRVRIATPPQDDFTILGFAVVQPPAIVHMVYVKAPFRRLGIATRLLAGAKSQGLVYTQLTKDVKDWVHDKYPGMMFDPYWNEDMGHERRKD